MQTTILDNPFTFCDDENAAPSNTEPPAQQNAEPKRSNKENAVPSKDRHTFFTPAANARGPALIERLRKKSPKKQKSGVTSNKTNKRYRPSSVQQR
jgi:hypothetical protein